jgi:hypothetical protein
MILLNTEIEFRFWDLIGGGGWVGFIILFAI